MRRSNRPRRRTPVLANTDDTVFARAHPSLVSIEERYTYRQRIARHRVVESDSEPTGELRVVVPYDGHEHFSREAADDVHGRLPHGVPPGPVDALIGHLVLVDHQDTDLATVLELDGRFGAHRVEVPVHRPHLPAPVLLGTDRYRHETTRTFRPTAAGPDLVPLQLIVRLSDPDDADSVLGVDLWGALRDDERLTSAARAVKRVVGFRPYLQLSVRARITLPARPDRPDTTPIVRRVSVALPSALSLSTSSLQLRVGGADHALQYDPARSDLCWFDVGTAADAIGTLDTPRHFLSDPMELRFLHPGELFTASEVELRVDVEVPDELLSGTRARWFDALGNRRAGGGPLRLRSMISTSCTVVLDHSFADRDVSPFQSFHFDEVVPDDLRVADLLAALVDQRFTIARELQLGDSGTKRRVRQLILAERQDGPDVLRLLVLVEGRRKSTERQARSAGGHRHTSKFDSGELTVFVRGHVRGDARRAVHEINALQLALRDRFEHLRAPR